VGGSSNIPFITNPIETDPEEKRALAELNLKAGQQAKTNAAFATALSLLKQGLALCDSIPTDDRPDVLYNQLLLERAECEYMCGDMAQAESILEHLMKQAKGSLERGQIYLIQINMYSYQNAHDQVLETTILVLGEFGFPIPRKPSGLRIVYEMLRTHGLLQKNLEGTIALAELKDPKYKLMGDILVAAATHIGIANDTLMAYIFPKYISNYMKYGVSEAFAFMMCSNAAFLFLAFDRYSFGIRTAEVAELLFERFNKQLNNRLLEGRIHFLRATMLQYYNPVESNRRFETGIALGWETGDDIYVDYDMGLHALNAIGTLDELNALFHRYLEMMKRFLNPVSQRSLQLGIQYIQALKGERDDWRTLGEKIVQESQKARVTNQFYYYYASCRIEIHYLFGSYSEALDLVEQSYTWKKNHVPVHVQQVILYRFLSIMAIYPQLSFADKAKNRWIMRALLRKMKKWSLRSEQSAKHKYLLMSAEWARLEGKDIEAMHLYDEAIQAAKDAGYLQHEATAKELAAAAQQDVNHPQRTISMESIAWSVIHFVMRTREPIILDNALQSLYASDPHIIQNKPKSILCLPLQNSDQTQGLIYLENSLTSHAFSANRLEMIDHIFSRLAYTQLQKKQLEKDKAAEAVQVFEVVEVKTSPALVESLTKREIEVFQLMNSGMTNKEIAAALEITEGTIKNHGFNIYGKLQVKSRIQAITVAKELKLIH
jgi:DNA-binding CsgD family transcriptional regulator